jgi:glycosyltransferase involved in cell wall biosynthesis
VLLSAVTKISFGVDSSSMPVRPQTSVIIAVKNGEQFVQSAVDSVLSQLETADELLVVDDGSTDATRSRLPQADKRLRLLTGAGLGPSAARNIGLAAAQGDFIAMLDHDDLWPAGRHRALRDLLVTNPQFDAAAGWIDVQVEPGGTLAHCEAFQGRHGPSLPWSCLYRRQLIEQVGGFDESLRYGEDSDYHARLCEAGMRLGLSPACSLIYRRHAGNATNRMPDHGNRALALVRRRFDRRPPRPDAAPKSVN